MGDLTENLSRVEFECRCGCGFNTIDFSVVSCIQNVADQFKKSDPHGSENGAWIQINSGCRCSAHNQSVGGAELSQHISGRAADFAVFWKNEQGGKCKMILPDDVANMVKTFDHTESISVGVYSTWVHVDSRSGGRKYWGG